MFQTKYCHWRNIQKTQLYWLNKWTGNYVPEDVDREVGRHCCFASLTQAAVDTSHSADFMDVDESDSTV